MQKNVNLINHILSLPQPRQMSCKTSWGERNKNANWTLIEVFLLAFIILISWTSSYVILMDFHMEIFHMHFLASTPFPTYNDREAFFALLTNSNAFECEPGRFIDDLSGFLCVYLVVQLIGENPAIAEPAEKIIRSSRVNNTGGKKEICVQS